jgi:hypothetical protein
MTDTFGRIAPDTPAHHTRMARIFLHEARKTVHRDWAFTLLSWAAQRRMRAQHLLRIGPVQRGLFNDFQENENE